MQTLLARDDDHIAIHEALGNLYATGAANADFDFYPLRHLAVFFCAVNHLDDEQPWPLRHQRFLGHHQGFVALAKHRNHPRKHAGAQLHAAIVNASPHAYRAAIGINLRVNRLHDGFKFTARQRVQLNRRLLALAHLALEALGQAVVHKHRLNVFDVDNVRAVFQIIAGVDGANAGQAVKRCCDFEACRRGLRQGQLGLGHFQVSGAFVHRALGNKVLCHQLLVALVVGQSDRQLGLALLDLRRLQLVVKLHQQLALAYAIAVFEVQLRNAPADLGAHHHALARAKIAHGLGVVGELHHLDLGHLHRRWARSRCARRGSTGTRLRACGPWRRRRLLGAFGLVLVPPRRARSARYAQYRHQRINCFGCHVEIISYLWKPTCQCSRSLQSLCKDLPYLVDVFYIC